MRISTLRSGSQCQVHYSTGLAAGSFNPVKVKSMADMPGKEKAECLKGYRWSSLKGFLYVRKREIGNLMGRIDYSAVSQTRKRFRERLGKNEKMAHLFRRIENRLAEADF